MHGYRDKHKTHAYQQPRDGNLYFASLRFADLTMTRLLAIRLQAGASVLPPRSIADPRQEFALCQI